MAFVPELFISIGATGAMFTLRETYLHTQWVGGRNGYLHKEVRSHHHYNLSTTPDEAFDKAVADSLAIGVPLTTTRESLLTELRDIQRATREEIERREREQKDREERWAAERAAQKLALIELMRTGIMSFGRFENVKFVDLPRAYVSWIIDTKDQFELESLMAYAAQFISEQVPHLALPKPNKDLYVGPVKQRETFTVTIVRSYQKQQASFSGWGFETLFITTMVDDQGACLMSFSTAFRPDVGQVLTIKGTVKEHSEYNGQAQTILQRIKVI